LYAELIRIETEDGEESEFDPERIAGEYNECDYAAFMDEYKLELDEDEEYEDEFEEEEAIKELIKEFLDNKSAFCAFTDEGTVVYFYNFE
jgi:DNA-binding LacI/PurR family transcriptional regulator